MITMHKNQPKIHMNFSNEMHVDTVHVFRRYVVELLYTLPGNHLHGIPFASYTDGWGTHAIG